MLLHEFLSMAWAAAEISLWELLLWDLVPPATMPIIAATTNRVAKRAKISFFFFLEMEMYLVVDSNFVAKNSFRWVILICWWVNQQGVKEKRLAYMRVLSAECCHSARLLLLSSGDHIDYLQLYKNSSNP